LSSFLINRGGRCVDSNQNGCPNEYVRRCTEGQHLGVCARPAGLPIEQPTRFNLTISAGLLCDRFGSSGSARAYGIIDAKRFALRRCECSSLLLVRTLTWCDPDRR
jgi:hypothetical protein